MRETEPLVVTAATNLEEEVYTSLKVHQARSRVLLRDIYHRAIEGWIQQRELLGDEAGWVDIGEMYRAAPKSPTGRRVTIAIYETYKDDVFEWAENDGRAYCDALYSAIVSYLKATNEGQN